MFNNSKWTKNEQFEVFKKYASFDKISTNQGHGAGIYQTFCHLHSKLFPAIKDYWAKSSREDWDLCTGYQISWWKVFTISSSITAFVQIINLLIKAYVPEIANMQGYVSKSERTAKSFQGIFLNAFLNSGFSQLIANMDSKETPLSILDKIPKKGTFKDMSAEWFEVVGPQLFTTSIILALNPLIDYLVIEMMRRPFMWWDASCCCCREKTKTKAKTLRQYLLIHQPPKYMMHFHYSFIAVQIWMMFTYGLFIPMIIPVTLFGILLSYVMDKVLLAYFFRQPPQYDHRLQKQVLEVLKPAPIMMYVLGFWVLGNRQAFHNEPDEFTLFKSDLPNPKHWLLIPLFKPFKTGKAEDFMPEHLLLIFGIMWYFSMHSSSWLADKFDNSKTKLDSHGEERVFVRDSQELHAEKSFF